MKSKLQIQAEVEGHLQRCKAEGGKRREELDKLKQQHNERISKFIQILVWIAIGIIGAYLTIPMWQSL